jgi:probable phosphoglycerate mutase
MTTYLLRHGRTAYSAQHLVNGDPTRPIDLDREGEQTCAEASTSFPWTEIRTLITSSFPRARKTGERLSANHRVPIRVEPLLNEIDYGCFEGRPFMEYAAWLQGSGPHARPPSARESQREGIRRMLAGVHGVLQEPGPRVVVAHGLLVSVVTWALQHPEAEGAPPRFLPEAACLTPMIMPDHQLSDVVIRLTDTLDSPGHNIRPHDDHFALNGQDAADIFATFESPNAPPEEIDPHA